MELTHYERVMKKVTSCENECRNRARKMAADEDPYKAFLDYMETLGDTIKGDVNLGHIRNINSKSTGTCHFLTCEFMRSHEDPYSFTALTDHPGYASVVNFTSGSRDQVTLNVAGHMHYHMGAHLIAGTKVYLPSRGLAEQLRYTELRGVTSSDLKLPYRAIYLMVPEQADLKIWNDSSGWHKTIGIYLVEEWRKESRSWRFLVCGETKPIVLGHGIVDENDALVYFNVPLPVDMKLADALATAQEDVVRDTQNLKEEGKDTFGPMVDEWQDIFRWAMNVVLYATTDEAEWEQFVGNKEARRLLERIGKLDPRSKRRKNLQGKLNRIRLYRRVLLGKSVTARRGNWTLTIRIRVRGHWRDQPYGPDRMYRKRKWIEPYWKGPDEIGGGDDRRQECHA